MGRQPHLQPQPAGLGQPQAGGLAREYPTSLGAVCAGALLFCLHPEGPTQPCLSAFRAPAMALAGSKPVANQGSAAPAFPPCPDVTCERAMVGVIYKFLQLLFGCSVAQQRNQLLLPAPPD